MIQFDILYTSLNVTFCFNCAKTKPPKYCFIMLSIALILPLSHHPQFYAALYLLYII